MPAIRRPSSWQLVYCAVLASNCATYDNGLLTSQRDTSSSGSAAGGSGAGSGGNGGAGATSVSAGFAGSVVAGANGLPVVVAGAAGEAGNADGGQAGASGAADGGGMSEAGAGGGNGTGDSTCAAHPITPRTSWTASASLAGAANPVAEAIDGKLASRWSTEKDQGGSEWLQIDFGAQVALSQATLQLGPYATDYPRAFATRFSTTSMDFAAPILVSGTGAAGVDTVMNFSGPTVGRYLLISQLGKVSGLWWSVAEIQLACSE